MLLAEQVQKVIYPMSVDRWLDLHRRAGHTYVQMAGILAAQGITISPVTLRRWCKVGPRYATTRCKHGHTKNFHNWRVTRNGHAYCHPCVIARTKLWRQRKRAERASERWSATHDAPGYPLDRNSKR